MCVFVGVRRGARSLMSIRALSVVPRCCTVCAFTPSTARRSCTAHTVLCNSKLDVGDREMENGKITANRGTYTSLEEQVCQRCGERCNSAVALDGHANKCTNGCGKGKTCDKTSLQQDSCHESRKSCAGVFSLEGEGCTLRVLHVLCCNRQPTTYSPPG
jgi:hypothetical protein